MSGGVVQTPLPVRSLVVGVPIPRIVEEIGAAGAVRFATFFTDNIRNANTRVAYHRAACLFLDWCGERRLGLGSIESYHVSAYVESLMACRSKSTVKQSLAAIRMLFDWLVVGQVVPRNPAHAVRGPKLVVTTGSTPVLDEADARRLLASIDTSHVVGLRDRALVGLMIYSFARINAALAMNVRDYFPTGKRWSIRLHEKGGKRHDTPAHHKLEEFLDAYLEAAGIGNEKHGPLFRTTRGQTRQLTRNRLSRCDAWRMVRRRAVDGGLRCEIGNHTFRATGITNYMKNGGDLKEAQKMACHSDLRTTQLYDRSGSDVSLDEIERITI
jgi:integrase/recombinase XerD